MFVSALAAGQAQPGAAQKAEPAVDLNTIVNRMEQAALANRDGYRAYVVTREYRMYHSDGAAKPASEVLAEISFVPPSTKEYKITEAQGSSRGQNVVHHILEDEAKATASGRAPGAITRENYDFTYLGRSVLQGHTCLLLGLHPKRKEKNLVIGRAWVDSNTYLIRRVEGEMAKLPSWWLKSVNVTLDFDSKAGMWLQTSMRAEAEVRIFGPHVLTSQAVRFQVSDTTASNLPPNALAHRVSRGAAQTRFAPVERAIGTAVPLRH